MIHLEGHALDWHHLYGQKHEGLHMLEWSRYVNNMREHFGSGMFWDTMHELVTLKQ